MDLITSDIFEFLWSSALTSEQKSCFEENSSITVLQSAAVCSLFIQLKLI